MISTARVSERKGAGNNLRNANLSFPLAPSNVTLIPLSIEASRKPPIEVPPVRPRTSSCCPPSDELPSGEWLLLVLNQQTALFEAFGIFKMLAPSTTKRSAQLFGRPLSLPGEPTQQLPKLLPSPRQPPKPRNQRRSQLRRRR